MFHAGTVSRAGAMKIACPQILRSKAFFLSDVKSIQAELSKIYQ
jgi:hypothetical protein